MNQFQWEYENKMILSFYLSIMLPLHSILPYNDVWISYIHYNAVLITVCSLVFKLKRFSLSHRYIYLKTTFTTKLMFRAAHGGSHLLDRRESSSTASRTGCMRV